MGASVRVSSNSKEITQAMEQAITKFLTEAGEHLEGEAKKEIEADPRRVDTGLLRNSITFALAGEPANAVAYFADDLGGEIGTYSGMAPESPNGEFKLYVGTNVKYAGYVHEGTSKMAPNRFLKNAFERNKNQIIDKLKNLSP